MDVMLSTGPSRLTTRCSDSVFCRPPSTGDIISQQTQFEFRRIQ